MAGRKARTLTRSWAAAAAGLLIAVLGVTGVLVASAGSADGWRAEFDERMAEQRRRSQQASKMKI